MLKWLNNKKKDNKGFSLVELIIVVAIMAILVGLLAPQYVKYVEKSRKSADASNLSEIVNAIQVKAADAESSLPSGGYKITISDSTKKTTIEAVAGDGVTPNTDAVDTIKAAVEETMPTYASTVLKSAKWGANGTASDITATVVIKKDGGTTVTYTPADLETFITNKKDDGE